MKKINKYIIEGKSVPGVTTIIDYKVSRQLMYWYAKNGLAKCQEISDESKAFGEMVHRIIGGHVSGQKQQLNDTQQVILDNFILLTQDWQWLENETVVLNREHMYGGTIDLVAIVEGKKTLVDVKSGNLYDGKETVQLAAYRACRDDLEQAKILHLDKETLAWEVLEQNTEGVFEVFLAFKKIYDYEVGKK